MNNIISISIGLLLLITTVAHAEWVDKQGNKIPDSDNMKSAGNLIAQLIVTDKEDKIFKNWNTTSEIVYFPTTNSIKRNKALTALVVFGGCATDQHGHCNLVMQMTIYKPDGSIYTKLPQMEIWSGKPKPLGKNLGLSVDFIRLVIEPHDPLGQYKIDVKVIDNISSKTMLLTSNFTAIE